MTAKSVNRGLSTTPMPMPMQLPTPRVYRIRICEQPHRSATCVGCEGLADRVDVRRLGFRAGLHAPDRPHLRTACGSARFHNIVRRAATAAKTPLRAGTVEKENRDLPARPVKHRTVPQELVVTSDQERTAGADLKGTE